MTAAQADAPATSGSQAQFAAANNWTRGYVTKLKQEGRLVFTADGQVDFAASLARIKDTTGAPERAAPPVQGGVYKDAQDRERFYTAELKRLELERETRKLLAAEEVDAVVDDAAAIMRSAIEGWRDRLPAQLVACGADEQRIAACLTVECDALLRRMADRFAALAGAAGAH